MNTKILLLFIACSVLTGCRTTQSGFVPVGNGGRLYYEERGQGEPLILLHGHSLDRRMWDEQFKVFSKDFRTIRMDFRGYGQSSPQSEAEQFTHVDDVLVLMDSLHISQAHVVGLSMGAFVAGDMLAMYPQRLLTCVLVSGGIRNSPGPSEPMDSAERARRDQEIAALKARGIDQYKREWIEQLMASGGSRKERMRKPLEHMIGDWTAWQPLHKEVRLFYGKEAWQMLRQRGKTDVPTLIIRGENELKGKKGEPGELRWLSKGRYVVLPDCGHMLNMEQPGLFHHTVRDFILAVTADR
ncbi:MAG: alpha/beta hydrolase [Prevotella sp.]|jgi:pimeloyl-ACP methyl ester carboxylesterase|nr:alpha/beta hydrolase [Prevotella sp.]